MAVPPDSFWSRRFNPLCPSRQGPMGPPEGPNTYG